MKKIRFGLLLLVSCLFLSGCGCEKEKSFTITFDANGGSEVASQTVKENGLVTKPTDPTKEGYTFGGWYLDEELFDFSTEVTSDLTLKASWGTNGNGIALNTTKKSIEIGESATIKATLSENIKDSDLTWKSSNETIATVDSNGKVSALKEGTAVITVATKDGAYTATCNITVNKKAIALNVTISGTKTVEIGKTVTLKANVTPSGTALKSTTWKSSNTSVATVTDQGVVTGVSAGTASITVTITDNAGNTKTASVKVTIPTAEVPTTPVVETTKYTVSFDSNGGSSVASQTVEEGLTASNPGNPTKAGYTFAGWLLNGSAYDFKTAVTKNITLTAKWEATYTVTLTPVDIGGAVSETYQYSVSVTKAGQAFSDYQGLVIDGSIKYVKGSGYMAASQLKNVGNASKVVLTLKDGSTVSANLIKN